MVRPTNQTHSDLQQCTARGATSNLIIETALFTDQSADAHTRAGALATARSPAAVVVLPSADLHTTTSITLSRAPVTTASAVRWLWRLLHARALSESASPGTAQRLSPVPLFVPAHWRLGAERASAEEVDGGIHDLGVVHVGVIPHPHAVSGDLNHFYLVRSPTSSATPAAASSGVSAVASHPQSLVIPAISTGTSVPPSLTADHRHGERIIAITPTYDRAEQRACLIAVAAQLRGAGNALWIVVEDGPAPLLGTQRFLESTGLPHIYLSQRSHKSVHRGVQQRNRALQEVRTGGLRGVVIFLDDDNTVDQRYFAWARGTTHLSLCTVGLIPYQPEVACADIVQPDESGRLAAVWSSWNVERAFPLDMLGIAVHTDLIQSVRASFSEKSFSGMLETDFLTAVVSTARVDRSQILACPADHPVTLFHTRVSRTNCVYPPNWVVPKKKWKGGRD
jgi:Glycosyltransferase family 43